MAMFAPIPLPGIDNPQFKDVMDFWQQLKDMQIRRPLLEAQAREANAQAKRQEKLSDLPFAGRELPGAAGRALALEMIKNKYGERSIEFQEAKSLYDLEKRRAEQTIAYQQSLMDTQGKRFSTPMGKLAQEQSEVESGVMPGTSVGGRQGELLTPEQKEKLQGQYSLKLLKDTTDSGIRQRVIYAKNMEKTLDNLNVDDLTSYSGIKGAGELIRDKGEALKGNITSRYKKYKESLVAAETLAKQVRQFYGDSITPGVQEGLRKLTNPTDWLEHPDIAKARFYAFKNILQTEKDTFVQGLRSAKTFEEEPEKNKKKKYSDEQLNRWADEARAAGVSAEKIAIKMAQLKGETE